MELRKDRLGGGAEHRGWKAGFGTAAAKEKLGIVDPLVGFLTEQTLLDEGQDVDVSGWGKAVLEPEVALIFSADVPADGDPEATAAAIGSVAAAIELVDLGEVGDAEQILSSNVFHRWYALGEPVPVDSVDAVRIDVAGIATGADPREALGDLVEVAGGIARMLDLVGEKISAGDVLITGAAIPAVTVTGGESFEVSVGDSRVAVSIS
jgi:2-keto-4-pentenoate hydratase